MWNNRLYTTSHMLNNPEYRDLFQVFGQQHPRQALVIKRESRKAIGTPISQDENGFQLFKDLELTTEKAM